MIRIENLTKSYPSKLGPQYIFKNLNFEFPTDHSVAILGKNGAGKSTLVKCVARDTMSAFLVALAAVTPASHLLGSRLTWRGVRS